MSTPRQIVCGHCGRINRLPAERTPEGARCGACHQPMFTGHPIEVDENGFDRHVASSDMLDRSHAHSSIATPGDEATCAADAEPPVLSLPFD